MKIRFVWPLFFAALIQCLPAAEPQVLIDTKFDQIDDNGGFKIIALENLATNLPLTMPTSVGQSAAFTITQGQQAIGTLKPPFMLLKVKEGTELAAPGTEIFWQITPLHLTSGQYVFSCQVTPLDDHIENAMIRVGLASDDNNWRWYLNALKLTFGPDTIRAGSGELGPPYTKGTPINLKITFDLDARTWSASADDTEFVQEVSFGPMDPARGEVLAGLQFQFPPCDVAIANVRLERLATTGQVSEEKVADQKTPRVACVGDSITAGYGLTDATKTYPAALRTAFENKVNIGNFGVSGTTMLKNGDSPYWNTPSFAMAKASNPDVVVIMLGTNDSKPQNFDKSAEIVDDTAAMVTEFRSLPSHPEVIVLLPVPVMAPNFGITEDLLAQLRPLIKQGAEQAGATVVETAPSFAGKAALFPDGVHPTEEGDAILAGIVKDHLPARATTPKN